MHLIRKTTDIAAIGCATVSVLTLAGCGSATDASPAPAASTASPGCELKADLVKLHGVAAGTSYWDVVVTNTGKAPCTLPAAPGLAVLGPDKKPLPVTVNRDPDAEPFPLAPGTSAAQAIGYGTDGNPPCDAETTYLRLTPPGVDLAFRGDARHCGNDALVTSTWIAGNHAAPQ
ncbi:DUF4232 domain-containing protein [Catenulispora subtropica]|uniref:DUF4232 domain-containing protein n=1 Tax=Catenulispora subtropica TaxID=450798 RepID=A0ABN2R538_9ACTN